jgi:phytoene dehydrogenase-like protein
MSEESNRNETVDYLVVGAGIAGHHIGALLANRFGSIGQKVLIVERSPKRGGRAHIIERDGYTLDYGIHAVRYGEKSALGKSLIEIGKPVEFLEPQGRSYVYGSKTVDKGTKSFVMFPTGIGEFLKTPLVGLLSFLSFLIKIKRLKTGPLLNVSLRDYTENTLGWDEERRNKGLGEFLFLCAESMMVCPFEDRVSFGEMVEAFMENLKQKISVTYPKGGWKSLFDGFAETIEKNNGIFRNVECTTISFNEGQAISVTLKSSSGDEYEVGVNKDVIITVPVQNIRSVLGELAADSVVDKEFIARCETLEPTAGVVIDVALTRRITDHSGIIFLRESNSFGQWYSNVEPSMAPEGALVGTWLKPMNFADVSDKSKTDAALDEMWKELTQAYPEVENNLAFVRRLIVPMCDGAEVNINQHRFSRPSCEEPIPGTSNVWLCGDSTSGHGAGGDIGHVSVRQLWQKLKKKLEVE